MKYLSLSDIKKHCRIDYDNEDDVLELYGSAAEDTILNLINRNINELIDTYGVIPDPIRHATLMLTAQSYAHHEPSDPQNLSRVGYSFDMMVKPYIRLADDDNTEVESSVAVLGSQIKIAFSSELPDDLTMKDVDFTVEVRNYSQNNVKVTAEKSECIIINDNEYVVLVDTEQTGVGILQLRVTYQIPDTDYTSGYRREVVNINPHVTVRG